MINNQRKKELTGSRDKQFQISTQMEQQQQQQGNTTERQLTIFCEGSSSSNSKKCVACSQGKSLQFQFFKLSKGTHSKRRRRRRQFLRIRGRGKGAEKAVVAAIDLPTSSSFSSFSSFSSSFSLLSTEEGWWCDALCTLPPAKTLLSPSVSQWVWLRVSSRVVCDFAHTDNFPLSTLPAALTGVLFLLLLL